MNNNEQLVLAVVVASVTLLSLVGMTGVLLIMNANRRQRHRAELAELHLERDQELRKAEREATGQTLSEVGRELHDNVGQLLTVAQLGLHDHLDRQTLAHPRVSVALQAVDEAVEEVRRLGRSLDQDRWQDRSLLSAIEGEAARLERLGKARVLLRVEGGPADPDRDTKTMLFRVFQETVGNALRHSLARTITIHVAGPGFRMAISD
ncbi:MAG: hypothetical protein KDB88_11935, partial [Flavobacteriales bacterium]|nr:hypothetical protein [Flavobacteriales bacterium]